MFINKVIPQESKDTYSSLLRIISQAYQWTWKHLPLLIRFTEQSTLEMTHIVHRDLLWHAKRGHLLDKGVELRGC